MTLPRLGVIIVSFNSTNVILDCLESLLASQGVCLSIVVVDNASTDDTVSLLQRWARGAELYAPSYDLPFMLSPTRKPLVLLALPHAQADHCLALVESKVNGGFAAGVNCGLAALTKLPEIDRFWILNPDSVVPSGTAHALATAESGTFSLMGGRVVYVDRSDKIQIDGGLINWWTGVTGNKNQYANPATAASPDPRELDFITGASMVASRAFYEEAGPMAEDYFLYYEEVDWALRRGSMPLAYCPHGIVYHRAGTAIGSPKLGRPASPFSLYFKHRGRMRFMRRHAPFRWPTAVAYSIAKAAQLWLKGYRVEARTVLGASFGRPPSPEIRARLSPEAQVLAFGPEPKTSKQKAAR